MTGRLRMVLGLTLILAYPVLLRVPLNQLPAAVAVVAIEAAVIGTVPFGIAFLAQTLLGRRILKDWALLLLAAVVVCAWRYLGQGAAETPSAGFAMLSMSVMLLWWFLSLGAVSARALRRRRLSRAATDPSEAGPRRRRDCSNVEEERSSACG